MAKKIKRQVGKEIQDTQLENVGEDRAFEVEIDEDTNEVIFVHHYRRKWGDEFDADVEHGLNIEEAGQLVGIMLQMIQGLQDKANETLLVEKVTPEPIEGNPMQGNKI